MEKRISYNGNKICQEGGNVKSFMAELKESDLGKLENSGEIFAFWGKRVPQIFKWGK